MEQVCVIQRRRKVGDDETTETVFAITSLAASDASAARLLALSRRHWAIENEIHWVRDVVLGEDACRVRTGAGPEVLAGLRNAALTLLRGAGYEQIAPTLRHFAAKPEKAIDLVMHTSIHDL